MLAAGRIVGCYRKSTEADSHTPHRCTAAAARLVDGHTVVRTGWCQGVCYHYFQDFYFRLHCLASLHLRFLLFQPCSQRSSSEWFPWAALIFPRTRPTSAVCLWPGRSEMGAELRTGRSREWLRASLGILREKYVFNTIYVTRLNYQVITRIVLYS